MTAPLWSVMETIVLLKDARTLTKPEVTFFEPLALRTLIVPSSSLRRSSAVGCLATPPIISTGLSEGAADFAVWPAAPGAVPSAAAAASAAALRPLAFFSAGVGARAG